MTFYTKMLCKNRGGYLNVVQKLTELLRVDTLRKTANQGFVLIKMLYKSFLQYALPFNKPLFISE